MEQDQLDDLFRDMIREDQTDLNKEEKASQEEIWNHLELPTKKKKPFHLWKTAAAILFLLLSGTVAIILNNNQATSKQFSTLNSELQQTKAALLLLEKKLNDSETPNQESTPVNIKESIALIAEPSIVKQEAIEKIVFIRDTIWLEANRKTNQNIRLVKDTIFIEVPAKSPAKWVNETIKKEELPVTEQVKEIVKKKNFPSKVEFVLGKKPLPKRKINLFSTKSEFAKKEAKKTNGIISIPINN